MANLYPSQFDGSYRRSTIPDQRRQTTQRAPYPVHPQKPAPPPPPPPEQAPPPCPPPQPAPPPPAQDQGILAFLKGLLPRQIDAADLLVISLLLLISREEEGEGGLSPLLTIALYFLL